MLRGSGRRGVLRRPGVLRSVREDPARAKRGSAGTGRQRRHGIAAAVELTGGAAQEKSRAAGPRSREQGLGVLRGVDVGLRRGFVGAVV